VEDRRVRLDVIVEEARLPAELVGLALLGTERRLIDVGDRLRETRGPAAGLEAFRKARVEHRVFIEMELRAHGGREDVVLLALLARREVGVGIARVRERRQARGAG